MVFLLPSGHAGCSAVRPAWCCPDLDVAAGIHRPRTDMQPLSADESTPDIPFRRARVMRALPEADPAGAEHHHRRGAAVSWPLLGPQNPLTLRDSSTGRDTCRRWTWSPQTSRPGRRTRRSSYRWRCRREGKRSRWDLGAPTCVITAAPLSASRYPGYLSLTLSFPIVRRR